MATITLYRLAGVDLRDKNIETSVFSSDRKVNEVKLKPRVAARLFISLPAARPLEWTAYLEQITRSKLAINPRENAGAVLLMRAPRRKRTLYAATWGSGHFLLRPERIEADLGIRSALNLLSATGDSRRWNPERVRAIRTKRVGQTTLISQTQASRKSSFDIFPFSIDADQLRQVTGSPADSRMWGPTITGGTSLHVRRPESARAIIDLCRRIDRVYRSTNYKKHYGWYDNVAPVNDPDLLRSAVSDVVGRLTSSSDEAVSLAPPSLIEWENVAKFEYQWGKHRMDVPEPAVDSFLEFVRERNLINELSLENLQSKAKVNALDNEGEKIGSWPLLRCLTAELEIDEESYILDEGGLFAVDKDYLNGLNTFVSKIKRLRYSLPESKPSQLEDPYNKKLAKILNGAILLDKKLVGRPDATPIEICDVALRDRILIHVKKGRSSSNLSHLFSQGVVSAELLHMDGEFRAKVKKLVSGKKLTGSAAGNLASFVWLYKSPFEPSKCEIAYVIMTGGKSVDNTNLPFFSKVNLRQRCNELRRMGFTYSLTLS